MAIQCVLFDADGVIINCDMFSIQYASKFDISPEDMTPFFLSNFKACVTGEADLKEVLPSWLPKWKWTGTVEEFLQFWFEAENCIDERLADVIKQLRAKGIKCYLATNQEKYRLQFMREHMHFEELFDGIFASCEIGHRKPEREYYEYALKELKEKHGISPSEVLFFDDKQRNVEAAKEVGIGGHFYASFVAFKATIALLLQ